MAVITVDVSTNIQRPVEEVFAFLTNIENLKSYARGVTEAEWLPPGYVGIGSRFRVVRSVMGRAHDLTCEVTDVRPNRKFMFRSISGSKVDFGGGVIFEDANGSTRVTLISEAEEPRGVLKLAVPMFVRTLRDELNVELASVKRHLERVKA
jgi:uncharacterized membrane protein